MPLRISLPLRLLAVLLLVAVPGTARAQKAVLAPDPHDSIDVASLTFEGAKRVAPSDLKLVTFTRTSSCRLVLITPLCKLTSNLLVRDRRRTTRAALGEDITALRVYYWRRGFREAQVDTALAPAKHGMAVTFRIVEGPATVISDISVTQRAPVLTAAELSRATVLREGDPFSLIALDTMLTRLREFTWNHGHGDVVVDTAITPPDAAHRVALRVTVDPRWITRVGSVEFDGNSTLSDATLRRGMLLQPGELYTHDAVLESERRLFQSPAISRALVVTPPAGDSVKQITVAVSETPAHSASATIGFNTIEFIQAGLQLRNHALGSGRWMEVRANAGNLLAQQLNGHAIFRQVEDGNPDPSLFLRPTYQGSLTLTQPWIAGPRTSASVTLFGGRRSLSGVVVDEDAGASVGIVRELDSRFPVGLNYRMETSRVQGGAVYFCAGYGICDDASIQALSRRQRLAPVGLSAWIDRADDLENPTHGYTAVVDAEHASAITGSTFGHTRIAADGSLYLPFGDTRENVDIPAQPFVLALHGRAGWVRPLASDRAALGLTTPGEGILHPRARFYAGGMQSVRGFAENELGPRVLEVRRGSLIAAGCTEATVADGSCDPGPATSDQFFTRPTGGSTLAEGSVELRIPVMRQLGAVAFLDGAWVGTNGLATPAHAKGAVTPGGGFRYRSPLGVLRLDVGFRPLGTESLPVVVEVPDGSGGQRIVTLATEKQYSRLEPSPGTIRSIERHLVVHFAMGQAF